MVGHTGIIYDIRGGALTHDKGIVKTNKLYV